ncbi:hypothetical protein EVG20_g6078 [Dentipellis fragilis]|uniref:Uncharacterized protein n=1 Tax=Dentipellis fragilis TaxID=205917 RepID=A0A4Y9YPG7_9AGAM|nr:hypothetical protein EVG20_g6078 [Dentipellis fragilis]
MSTEHDLANDADDLSPNHEASIAHIHEHTAPIIKMQGSSPSAGSPRTAPPGKQTPRGDTGPCRLQQLYEQGTGTVKMHHHHERRWRRARCVHEGGWAYQNMLAFSKPSTGGSNSFRWRFGFSDGPVCLCDPCLGLRLLCLLRLDPPPPTPSSMSQSCSTPRRALLIARARRPADAGFCVVGIRSGGGSDGVRRERSAPADAILLATFSVFRNSSELTSQQGPQKRQPGVCFVRWLRGISKQLQHGSSHMRAAPVRGSPRHTLLAMWTCSPAGGPVSFSVKQALQDPHEGETRKRTIFFPFICAISLHLGVYVRLFLAVSVAAQSEG